MKLIRFLTHLNLKMEASGFSETLRNSCQTIRCNLRGLQPTVALLSSSVVLFCSVRTYVFYVRLI